MLRVMSEPRTINDLAPADYNPRQLDERAAAGLSASLAAFGDIGGITYNRRTGALVAGHQRVEQLKAAGARLVEDGGLAVELPDTGQRWPVRVVDWDEATERAANISANNPHIAGQFTAELQPLLSQVEDDMGSTPFNDLRLVDLVKNPTFPDDSVADEPPSSLAVVEIRCDRSMLDTVIETVDGLRRDARFEVNIS